MEQGNVTIFLTSYSFLEVHSKILCWWLWGGWVVQPTSLSLQTTVRSSCAETFHVLSNSRKNPDIHQDYIQSSTDPTSIILPFSSFTSIKHTTLQLTVLKTPSYQPHSNKPLSISFNQFKLSYFSETCKFLRGVFNRLNVI